MKSRFINFEGIHGSGKSTTAWILHKSLKKSMISSKVFLENDIDNPKENPCDFRFMSALNDTEYNTVLRDFPFLNLQDTGIKYSNYYAVYYPNFKDNLNLFNKLVSNEFYNGRFGLYEFKLLMKERFTHFVNQALKNEYVYIFESVLFQHIINELLRFQSINKEQASQFINELVSILNPLNPILFYLYTSDVKGQIDKIAAKRLSDNYDLYPDWIDYMIEYVKNSKYGVDNNVNSRNDLLKYFYKRLDIESYVYDNIPVEKCKINIQEINKDELNDIVLNSVIK